MIAILYRSDALTAAGGPEDGRILCASQSRNASLDLTGFLHRESDVFYQWLEGPVDAVRQVYGSIIADPRHRNIRTLSEIVLTRRNFASWSMAASDHNQTSLFDWAAGAGVSLHQVRPSQILSFLLDCARRA